MFFCTICDEPARFAWAGIGHEEYCHCGLTFHRIRDPYTGEWIIGSVTIGEQEPQIPKAFSILTNSVK